MRLSAWQHVFSLLVGVFSLSGCVTNSQRTVDSLLSFLDAGWCLWLRFNSNSRWQQYSLCFRRGFGTCGTAWWKVLLYGKTHGGEDTRAYWTQREWSLLTALSEIGCRSKVKTPPGRGQRSRPRHAPEAVSPLHGIFRSQIFLHEYYKYNDETFTFHTYFWTI